MAAHAFGGNWTDDKLHRLRSYLTAYRTIFTQNPKAKYFTTWYVDAFAGTGTRTTEALSSSGGGLFEDVYQDRDAEEYRSGSARIALGLDNPFDRYLFVEKAKNRVMELESTVRNDYTRLFSRCTFEHGDANSVVRAWCAKRDWTKERAVVFLDPYGMQVEWKTIEALGKTNGIDLWYLFPLGLGVLRLLSHNGRIDETWQKRLDLTMGTDEWKSRFYRVKQTESLFGDVEEVKRDATAENIQKFIQERLSTCFAKVAKGLILRNSRSFPMYSLCFAAANKRGAPTAVRIAEYILGERSNKSREVQTNGDALQH